MELVLKLTKYVPDLDIRLEDVSDQITKLSPELRYSIGKPQKSGYEDLQMRFIRDFDKKKKFFLGANFSSLIQVYQRFSPPKIHRNQG